MIWYDKKDLNFYNGFNSIKLYANSLKYRKENYPFFAEQKIQNVITEIKTKGFSKIENAFDLKTIEKLKNEFDNCVLDQKIKAEDEHFLMVQDPLLHCKTAFDVSISDTIVDVAGSFFGCMPSLCTQNFRLSKVNDQQPKSTQLFHCDKNSINFIKFFIYLNDVDESGGPLTYVKGSNNKKPHNHSTKHRWSEKEIVDLYGEESICYLTAAAGDLLIANTTGFHKGTKPVNKQRIMLTLNYVVHEENDLNNKFKSKKEWFSEVPYKKKPLFDFMELT